MHPLVERLTRVLAPPAGAAAPTPWADAVPVLGSALPADYRDFVDRYGGGDIDGELAVLHPYRGETVPGAPPGFAGFAAFAADVGRDLAALQAEGLPGPSYPLFPSPGGLLVWGVTLNADRLFWDTAGTDPDGWPVVVWFRHRAEPWAAFEGPMTRFLLDLVSGPGPAEELLGSTGGHVWQRQGD